MNMSAITVVDSGSTTVTGLGGQSVTTGTATPGSFVTHQGRGAISAAIQMTGPFTGTFVAETSYDGGVTWYGQPITPFGETTTVASFTVIGAGLIGCQGASNIRVRCTTFGSGTPFAGVNQFGWL